MTERERDWEGPAKRQTKTYNERDGTGSRRLAYPVKANRLRETAKARAVSLSPEQLRLIEQWDADPSTPEDDAERKLRRDRRGLVPEKITGWLVLGLFLILFLVWLSFQVHHTIGFP